MNPNSLRNLVAPWKPGESANPGGKPGYDIAALICRRAFEGNVEEIYKGIAAKLVAGEPYAIQVAADRGFGKLKQGIIHQGDEDGGPIQASIKVEFVNADKSDS